jgi:hypothetical protein
MTMGEESKEKVVFVSHIWTWKWIIGLPARHERRRPGRSVEDQQQPNSLWRRSHSG